MQLPRGSFGDCCARLRPQRVPCQQHNRKLPDGTCMRVYLHSCGVLPLFVQLGGVAVTVCGQGFTASAAIFIGSSQCTSPQQRAPTAQCQSLVACTLPAGAGATQSVSVRALSIFSQAVPLLSYALPNLTSIAGCIDGKGQNCSRNGGDLLTVK